MEFLKKNILNVLLIIILLVVFFVPDAKALLIKGLMEVGFYNPKIERKEITPAHLNGIQFKDVKGDTIDLGDLRGKIIFLNFWATWCSPCRAELPSLNKLYTKFKADKNIVFIFVDADGDLSKSIKFMTDRKYKLPVFTLCSDIPKQIFENALPTTIIFDQQGRLSFRHEGVADYSDQKFVDFLDKLKQAE